MFAGWLKGVLRTCPQPCRSAAAAARGDSSGPSAHLNGASNSKQPPGAVRRAPEDSGEPAFSALGGGLSYSPAGGAAGPQWDLSGVDPLSGLPASFAPPGGYEPLGGIKEAAWGTGGQEADPLLGRYGYAPPNAAGGAPDDTAWGPEDNEPDDAVDGLFDDDDEEEGPDAEYDDGLYTEERHAPAAVEGAEAWSEEALAWVRARGDGAAAPRAATREQRWRERQA